MSGTRWMVKIVMIDGNGVQRDHPRDVLACISLERVERGTGSRG